jgi:hypothetical protein
MLMLSIQATAMGADNQIVLVNGWSRIKAGEDCQRLP